MQVSSVGGKYKCCLHTNRSQLLIMTEENHLHIIQKGVVQEYGLVVYSCFNVPASAAIQTKSFMFEG